MASSLPMLQGRSIGQDNALAKLRSEAEPQNREQIRKTSEDFESLFLNIVLKSMRETVQKSGLVDGGNAEDIYRSMLDEEYAKMMATQRHTGLADNIEAFLLTAQAGVKAESSGDKTQAIKAYQQAPKAAAVP